MEGPKELTDIQRFYKNTTVFLTGATGFVGKLALEKILRSLPVKKVLILVRGKKDVPPQKRVQELFDSPVFDPLKRKSPDVFEKVFILEGDCTLPNVGLSEADQKIIKDEVNVILHSAATTRFDEHLKKSVLINIGATKELIDLALHIKNLKTFVYIGTAYSNCYKSEIKEEIYPARYTAEQILAVCGNLNVETISSATESMISPWPNTYTFTKQIAEEYVQRHAGMLPICIVRPTIIVSTLKEPVSAYVDNFFNLAGFSVIIGLGLCKILYIGNNIIDLVPADMVVNGCIAAGWQTGTTFKSSLSEVPIYHISSTMDNPITKKLMVDYITHYGLQIPSEQMVTYPIYFRTTCKYNFLFWRMLFHTMVAHIVDFVLKLRGKQPTAVKGAKKLHYFMDTYEYFLIKEIIFHVNNTHKLLKKMSFQDRELFNFDMTTFRWEDYFNQFCRGLRIYIVKDPMSSLEKGRKHYDGLRRTFIVSAIIFTIVMYILGKIFLFKIVPFVFGLVLFLVRSIVC